MKIGDRIRYKRHEQGYTLEELARKVGVSKQTIQRYESGVISNIPSDKIESISAALKTSPTYLMGWEEEATIRNEEIQTYITELTSLNIDIKKWAALVKYAKFLQSEDE